MTVTTLVTENIYTGDGADTTFDFTFPILDETHLVVNLVEITTGFNTLQVIVDDYTVSGTGNSATETNYSSGTITFIAAPSALYQVSITREVPLNQEVDYTENDAFPADTAERTIDKLTMIAQDQNSLIENLVALSVTSDIDPILEIGAADANKYLRVNSDGDGLEMAALVTASEYNFPVGNGVLVQTAADTAITRTITGTAAEVTVTDGTGVAGNPTISLPTAMTLTGKTLTGGTLKATEAFVDSSDNEYFKLASNASAVNEFTLANSATGNGVALSATGGDSNIFIDVKPKGAGGVAVYHTSASGYYILPVTSGTAGQIMRTAGSGGQATWIDGGMFLLSSQTASASSTIDFTSISNSTYKGYILQCTEIIAGTDATDLWIRMSVGGTFQTGASDYFHATTFRNTSGTGESVSAGATHIKMNNASANDSMGTGAGESLSCTVFFPALGGTTTAKIISWTGAMKSAQPLFGRIHGGGGYIGATSAVDGIRVMMSSGNISSGKFTLYGLV